MNTPNSIFFTPAMVVAYRGDVSALKAIIQRSVLVQPRPPEGPAQKRTRRSSVWEEDCGYKFGALNPADEGRGLAASLFSAVPDEEERRFSSGNPDFF
ncbi:hypothetical protein HW932_19810 [Allochromatium humboldtianum]|uniref:Uncharacterized protein n=1 Tax=Allochromatium humboldtianum TaxID=504901 RepID=A0A850RKU4_9GAMM|nr:hypothetical protein [Allochromatium humboldtianum]NVZ11500.1 hypothetical protein [Allochromatium humboldtianum]